MITTFTQSNVLSARARQVIPGGAHTYSKGADQSPELGPKVIRRGYGAHVWDADENEYVDWAMGLTAVSLGHAYEPVLDAVRAELHNGCNFQCPSPIELEYAEHFLTQVSSAEMVKFAKNGSTVTTAAVKLSRAITGRKYVAYCVDHGFFSYDDWYIGRKPNNSGVPEETAALSLAFRYNDIKSLETLFEEYPGQIACVILEPMEFDYPTDGFLDQVRRLCTSRGAVLILDEMITGFRLHYPGAHRMLEIEPDLTTWGKGIANGFSVCALAGKREIMKLGGIDHTDRERVFLMSTTHGAETHALAAALATMKELQRTSSVERNISLGRRVRDGIQQVISHHRLDNHIRVKGHDAWLLMQYLDEEGEFCDGFKTLAFQEFAMRGILFRGSFVPTISHTTEDLEKTLAAFDCVAGVYAAAIDAGGYARFLVGDPIKPVFRKWN